MLRNKYFFTAVLLLAVAACACLFAGAFGKRPDQAGAPKEKKLVVATSFYPVYIAALNVAGDCDGVEVKNLSEPQTGCLHDFQLAPEDMKLLSGADLFLVNGGGMESFLTEVAEQYPGLLVEEVSDGLFLPDGNAHAWMSVPRYRQMVAAIAKHMGGLFQEGAREIEANAADYDEKLAVLCERQEKIREQAQGRQILSFHDAYEYLADELGLEIAYSLNLDEEGLVGAKEVRDAVTMAGQAGASLLLAEELYGRDLAETVKKETDLPVCYLDTLTRGEYDADSYLNGMSQNLQLLEEALGETGRGSFQ